MHTEILKKECYQLLSCPTLQFYFRSSDYLKGVIMLQGSAFYGDKYYTTLDGKYDKKKLKVMKCSVCGRNIGIPIFDVGIIINGVFVEIGTGGNGVYCKCGKSVVWRDVINENGDGYAIQQSDISDNNRQLEKRIADIVRFVNDQKLGFSND
jgi:hypothetical protein